MARRIRLARVGLAALLAGCGSADNPMQPSLVFDNVEYSVALLDSTTWASEVTLRNIGDDPVQLEWMCCPRISVLDREGGNALLGPEAWTLTFDDAYLARDATVSIPVRGLPTGHNLPPGTYFVFVRMTMTTPFRHVDLRIGEAELR